VRPGRRRVIAAAGLRARLMAAPAGAWRVEYDHVGGSATTTWIGTNTCRFMFTPAAVNTVGSKVRATLRAGTLDLPITKAYVGIRAASGDPYDFATTPTPLTFNGGSAAATIPALTDLLSDEVDLPVGAGDGLVISIVVSGGRSWWQATAADGISATYKAGDDGATVDASGYPSATARYMVRKLEIFGVPE